MKVEGMSGARARADQLKRLFNPRSIALVGATEKSIWSNSAYDNIKRFGFEGSVHLVNPKGGTIYDQAAATSCAGTGEQLDVALLMVPERALIGAVEDAAAAGASGVIVLSGGFAELGDDGVERQRKLMDVARALDIRVLGPNCLGYINYVAKTPLWTNLARRPMRDQTVALVSQSGATAQQLALFAYQQRIGFSHMIATGNEADVDVADAISYLADEETVRSIALFVESVRRPAAFVTAVQRAQAAGKPVIVLKVGASEAVAKAAQAHTGALVGDDRVFSAICHKLGMPRVETTEDLITVADLIARIGPLEVEGLALVGMSGGMCEVATDNAEKEGVSLAKLTPRTVTQLRSVLPDLATPNNPLDVTGAAMLKPEFLEHALTEIAKDPGVGLVTYFYDVPPEIKTAGVGRVFLKHVGDGFKAGGKPSVLLSHNFTPVTGESRTLAEEAGIIYSGAGVSAGVRAIGHLFRWSAAQRRLGRQRPSAPPVLAKPRNEREVLAHLQTCGVPIIPGVLTQSAEEAVSAASNWDDPTVLKIVSPDIAHKTEVGGVALNLIGKEAVHAAWTSMMARVREVLPDACIEGIVVSPMRRSGVELFVGTMRDPQWGPVIAVGLGGVFVEALKDTSLRLLPVSEDDVLEMFDELRGKALLDGFRGSPRVDRPAAAKAIVAIGDAALAFGDGLVSLEVNPLLAAGPLVEALDGLTIWEEDPMPLVTCAGQSMRTG